MSRKQPVNVGLLVAHGVGQQARYETIRALAAALRDEIGNGRCSVIDRTGDRATLPPSCPPIGADSAPIVLACTDADGTPLRIHLHEAWWADLGASAGLRDQLRFWLWGLGQAGETVKSTSGGHHTNTDKLMSMPGKETAFDANRGAPGTLGLIPRLALAIAAVQAVWTVMVWEALRAVLARFVPSFAGSALLVQYLGDVRTYTARADPCQANLLDPGQPMRATIRRRMVREMVAMAERGYDRWYIMGHSLGSVLVFNAVQEPEVNLANYLDYDQWQRVVTADTLATPQAFMPPNVEPNYGTMMPRRPTWLTKGQGISRTALFANFRGLITYGSPLDKFAALWPRVVPINKQPAAFPAEADWLNLSDATDPVGAELQFFDAGWAAADETNRGPHNRRVAASKGFLLAHIRYFSGKGRADTAALTAALVSGTRLSDAFENVETTYGPKWLRWVIAGAGGLALGLILFVAASFAIKLASIALAKMGWFKALNFAASAMLALVGPALLVAIAVIARWARNKPWK